MQKGSLRRWTCTSLSLSAILLCAAWLLAQSSAEQLPAPTIRVNTRLVLVDVAVIDRQGKPVTGLKAEDFTIEEKGKKQKVAFFQTPEEAQKQNMPPQLGPGLYTTSR